MDVDLVVKGGSVVCPVRGVHPANIAARGGRIVGMLAPGEPLPDARETIDATRRHVFPGCIDAHLHFGFGQPTEEYRTETASAAMGGITTVVAHLLNSDSYGRVFAERLKQCAARAHVDFAFHFSMAAEAHLAELDQLVSACGVTSFKYFMNFKGEEGRYMGLPGTDAGYMFDLMRETARFEEVVLCIHPENIELVNRLKWQAIEAGRDALRDYCLSKPDFTETENIVSAMMFAERTGAAVYFVHVSCASGIDEIRRFRERHGPIYLETCPHYLTHTLDTELGTLGKANPPLRTAEDVEALWAALADGTVDVVGSDHVPRVRATKEKNIWQAAQGFPGTATLLPVLLSEGYHTRGLALECIAELVCKRPAEIFGMDARKGFVGVGADADLTIVDLELEKACRWQDLCSEADYSPYDGWTLKGWPVMTIVRGRTVMRDGVLTGEPGLGTYLHRPLVANARRAGMPPPTADARVRVGRARQIHHRGCGRPSMGAGSSPADIVQAFEARLSKLLEATRASRVTLRLDLPTYGFHVNDVAAEARQPDVASLKGQTSIDQRRAPTVMWLDRERRILVQSDLTQADPACPPELIKIYGTLAQMLAPLVVGNELIGWVSVHHNGGPRDWQPSEVDALRQTAAWFTDWLEQECAAA